MNMPQAQMRLTSAVARLYILEANEISVFMTTKFVPIKTIMSE
jgi:hypothetical protein